MNINIKQEAKKKKMRAQRVSGKRKANKLEMEVIKKINASIEEMAKQNNYTAREPSNWQLELMRQE